MSLLDSRISQYTLKMDYSGDFQFLNGRIQNQEQIQYGSMIGSGNLLSFTNEVNSTIIQVQREKSLLKSDYIIVEDGKGTKLGTANGSFVKRKKLILKNVQGKEILFVIKSGKDKFSIVDENGKIKVHFSRQKIKSPSKGIFDRLKKNFGPQRLTYSLIVEDLMYERILLWGCFAAFLLSIYGYEPSNVA